MVCVKSVVEVMGKLLFHEGVMGELAVFDVWVMVFVPYPFSFSSSSHCRFFRVS